MFYFDDGKSITIFFKSGESAVWQASNPNYAVVKDLAEKSEWIAIETLNNASKAVIEGTVEIKDDKIVAHTEDAKLTVELPKDNKFVKFVQLLKDRGVVDTCIEEITPFIKKLVENQFIDAVEEVYDFCKAGDFEITKDGNLIAYKKVRKDLGSVHDSGNTKHVIGEYTEVKNFDTNRHAVCSAGLHFCSRGYLNSYSGEQVIAVEIDPRDIVSIPTDYSFQKGRCRRYKTLGILGLDGKLNTTNFSAMTDGKVKVVKSKKKKLEDQKEARQDAQAGSRLQQTADLMAANSNDVDKVARIMGISPKTVRRNMQKLRKKEKDNA